MTKRASTRAHGVAPDAVTRQPQQLTSAQVDVQQRLVNKYKGRYHSIVPSSYAAVVIAGKITTYRFFVRASEWAPSRLLEVPVREGERV